MFIIKITHLQMKIIFITSVFYMKNKSFLYNCFTVYYLSWILNVYIADMIIIHQEGIFLTVVSGITIIIALIE